MAGHRPNLIHAFRAIAGLHHAMLNRQRMVKTTPKWISPQAAQGHRLSRNLPGRPVPDRFPYGRPTVLRPHHWQVHCQRCPVQLLLQMWPIQGNILHHRSLILNPGEVVKKAWATSTAWHQAELETYVPTLT